MGQADLDHAPGWHTHTNAPVVPKAMGSFQAIPTEIKVLSITGARAGSRPARRAKMLPMLSIVIEGTHVWLGKGPYRAKLTRLRVVLAELGRRGLTASEIHLESDRHPERDRHRRPTAGRRPGRLGRHHGDGVVDQQHRGLRLRLGADVGLGPRRRLATTDAGVSERDGPNEQAANSEPATSRKAPCVIKRMLGNDPPAETCSHALISRRDLRLLLEAKLRPAVQE